MYRGIRRLTTRAARRAALPALLAAGALLVGCNGATNITLASPEQAAGITVSGTGSVTAVPDLGVLTLGVQATRPTVAEARNAAAKSMDAVRASLRSNGIEEKDIATQAFNIQPQYEVQPRPTNGGPAITGYLVTNQITVKVRQIDSISRVLDGAVAAGGNDVRVNGIQFTVDQPEKYRNEARDKAVADARARAEQLAKAAGVSLGKPRSITESFSTPTVGVARAVAPSAAGAGPVLDTPVSPGETQVTLSVNVVFGIQ